MTQKIRKAVFPVAGLGTRFLPATKANPKEMLPIVDKPVIQYAVQEAVAAGVEQIIFVTAMGKHAIENHFDRHHELEYRLEAFGKSSLIQQLRDIMPDDVACLYVRQPDPLGLGDAIACAEAAVGDEPFLVLLCDDLIDEAKPGDCLRAMIDCHLANQSQVIAVEPVDQSRVSRYGVVSVDQPLCLQPQALRGIVEKPSVETAPSNLAVIGRYLLMPSIFKALKTKKFGVGSEIQLTDAIQASLALDATFTHRLQGRRFDCGSKLGYMQANVHYGMRHHEIGPAFSAYLKDMLLQREKEAHE